jgi:hypothetical protein
MLCLAFFWRMYMTPCCLLLSTTTTQASKVDRIGSKCTKSDGRSKAFEAHAMFRLELILAKVYLKVCCLTQVRKGSKLLSKAGRYERQG